MESDEAGTYTAHYVLAGAYRGRDLVERLLRVHASLDESYTALCRTVRTGALCDEPVDDAVTCPVCLARIARRGLVRNAVR